MNNFNTTQLNLVKTNCHRNKIKWYSYMVIKTPKNRREPLNLHHYIYVEAQYFELDHQIYT